MEKYLDVVKLVKRLREFKIIFKKLLDKNIINNKEIFSSSKQLIDLDDGEPESSSMDSSEFY